MSRATDTEIGFVWLCFLMPRKATFSHNLLFQKMLCQFHQTQIGFVFSTKIWVAATSRLPYIGIGMVFAFLCLSSKLALLFLTLCVLNFFVIPYMTYS